MKFTYITTPPNKYTFQMPQVKRWTEKNCKGKVLNLFAGLTTLLCDEFRVDIDKNMASLLFKIKEEKHENK